MFLPNKAKAHLLLALFNTMATQGLHREWRQSNRTESRLGFREILQHQSLTL